MFLKSKFILLISILSIFFPSVASVGLSPPQLRIEDAIMGHTNSSVASITVMNTEGEQTYFVLSVSRLQEERAEKLRVICFACNRHVGIQRRDLVDGNCPFCGAGPEHLIMYDLPPDNILDDMNLECEEYPLMKMKDRQWRTIDKVAAGDDTEIDIFINIPDEEKYYGQHWEARIMATSVPELEDLENFIVYGIEAKVLIDTPALPPVVEEKSGINLVLVSGILVVIATISIVLYFVFFRTKKESRIEFPKDPLTKGRKLL